MTGSDENQYLWSDTFIAESPTLAAPFTIATLGFDPTIDDIPPSSLATLGSPHDVGYEQEYLFALDIVKLQSPVPITVLLRSNHPGASSSHDKDIRKVPNRDVNPYVPASPLHKLHVFPDISQKTPAKSSRTSSMYLFDLKQKYHKLAIIMPPNQAPMLLTRIELALGYREQLRYESAKALHQKILSIMEETDGSDHHMTLDACLNHLKNHLLILSELGDARNTIYDLHDVIVNNHSQDPALLCKCLGLCAD